LLALPRVEDYVELFADVLDTAVADRIGTGTVSAHLSGGLDSGAVVASAATLLRARGAAPGALRTVTAVLGGDSGDEEGDYAAEVREALGLDGTVIDATEAQPTDPFAPPDIRLPEPAPYQRTDLQLRIARASIPSTVVLSGLGGDVLLGFVPPWWIDAALRGRPVWVARALLERPRLSHERPHLGVRAILAALRSRPAPIPAAGWVARQAGRAPVPRRRELTPPRLPRFDLRDFVTDPTWPTAATLAHPTTTNLPLRFVHPFYDLRLVSLVAGLSPELWLRSKRILREATRERLPERVRTRPKTPLVRALTPGDTPEASTGLRDLVLLAPDLDRFVERELLAEAASVPGQSRDFAREMFVCRGLGLAHWLTHRRPEDNWQQP
jgi:asparagine synthase (glutamine-hydrolysing)